MQLSNRIKQCLLSDPCKWVFKSSICCGYILTKHTIILIWKLKKKCKEIQDQVIVTYQLTIQQRPRNWDELPQELTQAPTPGMLSNRGKQKRLCKRMQYIQHPTGRSQLPSVDQHSHKQFHPPQLACTYKQLFQRTQRSKNNENKNSTF